MALEVQSNIIITGSMAACGQTCAGRVAENSTSCRQQEVL